MPSQPKSEEAKDLRVLVLWGTEFFVPWDKVTVGSSFFIPTTATPTQVRFELRAVERALDMKFEAHARREYGRYGVRVWRVY